MKFKKSMITILATTLAIPTLAQEKPTDKDKADNEAKMAARANQVRGDEITPSSRTPSPKASPISPPARPATAASAAATAAPAVTLASPPWPAWRSWRPATSPAAASTARTSRSASTSSSPTTQESGLIASDKSHGPMYGHGFATLFLGEVYGMTGDEEVKEKLQKAVRLIQKTQNREGGWRYQPVPYDADISVTICEIMGLRAARDAGIKVEKEVIDKAIKYVRRCQNPDGGFTYMAGQGRGSGFARSAAGVASLYYAGIFEGDDIKRGLDYLKQFAPGKARRRRRQRRPLLLRQLLRRPGHVPRRRRLLGQVVPRHPRPAHRPPKQRRPAAGTATSARTTPPRWR